MHPRPQMNGMAQRGQMPFRGRPGQQQQRPAFTPPKQNMAQQRGRSPGNRGRGQPFRGGSASPHRGGMPKNTGNTATPAQQQRAPNQVPQQKQVNGAPKPNQQAVRHPVPQQQGNKPPQQQHAQSKRPSNDVGSGVRQEKKTKLFSEPSAERGPTVLPKSSGFSRMYIGNLPSGITEAEVRELFKDFCRGEKVDLFLDTNKWFGFIKLPHREDALAAKAKLDNTLVKGRPIRIRFSKHAGGVSVKNLGSFVSNEMLHRAFREFGELEKAVVLTDEKGKPQGEGRVYFSSKHRAQQAITKVNDGIFFLGASPRPIVCEELHVFDDEDGLPEDAMKSKRFYLSETEKSPRFAERGSPEFHVGAKWRELYECYRREKEQLDLKFDEECQKMEREMERMEEEMRLFHIRQNMERQRQEMEYLEQRIGRRYGGEPPRASNERGYDDRALPPPDARIHYTRPEEEARRGPAPPPALLRNDGRPQTPPHLVQQQQQQQQHRR